jgi:hypothetical protein
LPLRVVLILAVCICGLAVHFVAEGLSPVAGAPGFDLAAQGGQTHLVHEHCEDNFVFLSPTRLTVEHVVMHLASPAATGAFSISISPLLPPPNF